VRVAVADVNGYARSDIATAAGPSAAGGVPEGPLAGAIDDRILRVLEQFDATDPTVEGGAFVAGSGRWR
jgi:hypothetical protein